MHTVNKNFIFRLVQIATICVFLGRAWQHLVWDAPFRTLLWDENWMSGIVEGIFNTSWNDYITSPEVDAGVQTAIKSFGVFYLICAVMAIFIKKWKRIASAFMFLGSLALIFLALLYCKERFFSVGQFLEYSLQFSSPILLYLCVKQASIRPSLIFWMKVAIAFTFVCHGLYAIGYYPRPGYFTEMTMLILGVSENTAISFLKVAGILDFIIGVGIFLPNKIAKWIMLYAVIWGGLTTLARVVAYVEMDYLWETANQWVFESVYRVPHFAIPLAVWYYLKIKTLDQSNPNNMTETPLISED